MNQPISDKRHHRMVTLISLVVGLAIYFSSRFGLLGERLETFAPYYLVIILVILGVRALLAELGYGASELPLSRSLRNENPITLAGRSLSLGR
jgi:hypothetical protein